MVGVGIYVMASTGDTTMATAAVYNAITGLGDNLRNVLSSPPDLALGVVITGIVLIGLWYIMRILRSYNNSNSGQSK
jgi:lysozyme family protein